MIFRPSKGNLLGFLIWRSFLYGPPLRSEIQGFKDFMVFINTIVTRYLAHSCVFLAFLATAYDTDAWCAEGDTANPIDIRGESMGKPTFNQPESYVVPFLKLPLAFVARKINSCLWASMWKKIRKLQSLDSQINSWMMSSWLATSQELIMQCKSQLMLAAHSRRWRPIALRRLMVPNFKAKVFDASHGGDFWRCSLQSCGERVTWIADECWWATMKWTAHVLGIPFLTHIHMSIPMTIHDFTTKQRTSRDAARSMKAGWSHWNAHDRVWLLTQIQVYPPVKHGNGKSPVNGAFNGSI